MSSLPACLLQLRTKNTIPVAPPNLIDLPDQGKEAFGRPLALEQDSKPSTLLNLSATDKGFGKCQARIRPHVVLLLTTHLLPPPTTTALHVDMECQGTTM